MNEADVLSIDGKPTSKMTLPKIFEEGVRPELIQRAVIAESTQKLQPQGHFPLAGMQTTARYYGRMQSYRTGRHMGVAIRPRQKLGNGVQGDVRRIPSATKGKRAHPHMVEKIQAESMNKREYRKALASAVSATYMNSKSKGSAPLIVAKEIESITKSKDMLKVFTNLKISEEVKDSKKKVRVRKGLRRSANIRHYKRSVLLVTGKDCNAIKAARNIAGVDACVVSDITANLLAPGGVPGRTTVWSEQAISALESAINTKNIM